MTTFLAQNQYFPNSAPARTSPGADAAVVSDPPVVDATAVPISNSWVSHGAAEGASRTRGECGSIPRPAPIHEPSITNGGGQEAPAPSCCSVHLGAGASKTGTEFIHEIFFYARRLLKDAPAFVFDESRFLADIDEEPLFLREDGYLQRREA